MNDQLRELADARQRLAEAKQKKADLYADFESRVDVIQAYEAIQLHTKRVSKLTEEIQAAALSEYARTGAKKQPGVTVKLFTVFRYNAVEALDWARKHLAEALTLDKNFFEEHAKGVRTTTPIPCVEFYEEPRAQIAGDLSQFIQQPAEK